MRQTDMEKALCRHLKTYHRGQRNAASSRELEAAFSVKGAELRRVINGLRCRGFPICSDGLGYYYAATQAEVNATVAHLNGRIAKIAGARNGLLRCAPIETEIRQEE